MPEDLNDKLTEHGRVASHPARTTSPLLVAPTTTSEFNTLSLPLPAVACIQMADVLFEFDSSFVLPEAGIILKDLPTLRKDKAGKNGDLPPLGVFGHADPEGDDEYNKKLSGRRAKAIYGLLTHNVGLWTTLLHSPMGGDDWLRKGALGTMRKTLGASDKAKESDLITAYMSLLFPNQLAKSDFLARGADAQGKGDFQGCSRFNLLIALSQADEKGLPEKKRNLENRPNRRVVIFLFRPGSKVTAKLWPCPNADEPSAGCKTQFFVTPPPGDQRRKLGSEQREHAKLADTTNDTFACAFYDEISHLSPCEKPVPPFECCRHRGIVVSNVDPSGIGRLQVKVPDLLGPEPVFAMPSVPFAGPRVGLFMMPPVGASVWVEFEAGDTARPIWCGCFWAAGEAPAEAAQPANKFIKTVNASLLIAETPGGSVTIAGAAGGQVLFNQNGIDISDNQGAQIDLTGHTANFNLDALEVD